MGHPDPGEGLWTVEEDQEPEEHTGWEGFHKASGAGHHKTSHWPPHGSLGDATEWGILQVGVEPTHQGPNGSCSGYSTKPGSSYYALIQKYI